MDASFGHDSNVNSSTSQGSLYVPLFGVNFTLASTAVKRADAFLAVGGGVDAAYELGAGYSAIAGADMVASIGRAGCTGESRGLPTPMPVAR